MVKMPQGASLSTEGYSSIPALQCTIMGPSPCWW